MLISWSGELSHAVAQALHQWLPRVLQHVRPWISSENIRKGTRWNSDLARTLESVSFGIACVVPGNETEPWLNFEAGAISKWVEHSNLSPFLVGVEPDDLTGPLGHFQATRYERADVLRLIRDLNALSGQHQIGDGVLVASFDAHWMGLEQELDAVVQQLESHGDKESGRPDERGSSKHEFKPEEMLILGELAERASSDTRLSRVLKLHPTRLTYFLERLQNKKLVEWSGSLTPHTPAKWSLTTTGRALVVEQGLIAD